VNLYYDNSVKLATTSTGVTITGTALSDNFTDASGYTIPYRRNALINGNFIIGQRGTSFTSATTPANSDDTYLLDRWIILSDGNDIVDVTQTTTVPTTLFKNSIGLDVETTNKKFGILQVIENQNCYHMIGRTVTFSFWAKVSDATKLDNVKAAIISWDSTADTVTSDVVNAWENEGTEPTLAANWTYENTPANLGVTTSWVKYTVSAAVDTASTANIAVFIWSDVTDTTAGHFLYITGCQLEVGPVATDFEFRQISDELILCQRYYEKSYNIADIPGTATATAVIYQVCAAYGTTAIDPGPFVFYKVRKRIAVNPTFYNHVTGSSGSARGGPAGAPQNCNPVLVGASENGFGSYFNTLVGLTDATAVAGWFHFVCDAEL
jgi:hypothetical protein